MNGQQADEFRMTIPGGLTPDLVEMLALLHDAPDGAAESTIALLRYGSRSNLAAHGIIGPLPSDRGAAAEICITDYGWQVIEACARRCGDTDEHAAGLPAGRVDRAVAGWRAKAEAADRELRRVKAHARERFHDIHPQPGG